ncbi:hypothetical protein MTO96_006514 [Rhipicephalus appendiculatus]
MPPPRGPPPPLGAPRGPPLIPDHRGPPPVTNEWERPPAGLHTLPPSVTATTAPRWSAPPARPHLVCLPIGCHRLWYRLPMCPPPAPPREPSILPATCGSATTTHLHTAVGSVRQATSHTVHPRLPWTHQRQEYVACIIVYALQARPAESSHQRVLSLKRLCPETGLCQAVPLPVPWPTPAQVNLPVPSRLW